MLNISGLREDAKQLKWISNSTSLEYAKHLAELPLLVIPSVREHSDWAEFFNAKLSSKLDLAHIGDIFKKFTSEFVLIYKFADTEEHEKSGWSDTMYAHITTAGHRTFKLELFQQSDKNEDVAMHGRANIIFGDKDSSYSATNVELVLSELFKTVMDKTGQTPESIMKHSIAGIFSKLTLFDQFAFEQDMYLTSVTANKPRSPRNARAHKRQPWRCRHLPRLIYLNQLPVEPAEHRKGHHRSPKPHQKRGFFRTLKHPKFKKHPLYMVYKGVYVRPAWVGKITDVIEGNRYTIVTGAH